MDSFWTKKQLIGLSPMDGVTDAAFRYITDKYGKPDILFTEFVPVEGLARGATKLLQSFVHHATDTPTIAQIYGTDLNAYYQAAIVAAELGFDGIDINMGCPDRAVARKGAGAGLIKTPRLAQDIIRTVKRAVIDWSEGQSMEKVQVHDEITQTILKYRKTYQFHVTKKILPVSVKTRIGYDTVVTEDWMNYLLEAGPIAISVHGRTLAQMYTGRADWDEIGKAAALAHDSTIRLLGNGDISSLTEAKQKLKTYRLDGILIGRASFGNPWIFSDTVADYKTRLKTALEHAEIFAELLPDAHFVSLRKHMAWYCRGFDHAAEVREKLMHINTVDDVRRILREIV